MELYHEIKTHRTLAPRHETEQKHHTLPDFKYWSHHNVKHFHFYNVMCIMYVMMKKHRGAIIQEC